MSTGRIASSTTQSIKDSSTGIAVLSVVYMLLGRVFFVFSIPSDEKEAEEISARSCLPIVSIRPKVWKGKYQNHLANDGVSSHVLNRKKKHDLAEDFFS